MPSKPNTTEAYYVLVQRHDCIHPGPIRVFGRVGFLHIPELTHNPAHFDINNGLGLWRVDDDALAFVVDIELAARVCCRTRAVCLALAL